MQLTAQSIIDSLATASRASGIPQETGALFLVHYSAARAADPEDEMRGIWATWLTEAAEMVNAIINPSSGGEDGPMEKVELNTPEDSGGPSPEDQVVPPSPVSSVKDNWFVRAVKNMKETMQ